MKVFKNPITLLLLIFLHLNTLKALGQTNDFIQSLNHKNHWVDSVYKKMNRKKRIAQLFFIRANTNQGETFQDSIAEVIRKEQIGGVVFFQGGPVRQAILINRYQSLAKVPLIIAMDGEWGLGMRLDSTISYPFQMTLGAIQDNTLIYKMGQKIAWDFKRLGMQMNFAPDMDVNNNPNNPVINYRSFGDNKYNVAKKGIAYLKGMQDGGLLTTAKHFPGHGDTNVDSHLDLPLLPFSLRRLDTLEEYPFKEAIKAGISGVMIAHMDIPVLDSTKNQPSTLSRPIVTGILRDSLLFKGLIVSDAMEMKAVQKYFPDGEADVKAFLAGNNIIELSENSKRAVKLIRKVVRHDKISNAEFESRVKSVLSAKYWAGLNQNRKVVTSNLIEDLNRSEAKNLVQDLCDAAITLLKGDAESLQQNPKQKTALVSIGVSKSTVFQQQLSNWYTNNTLFIVDKNTAASKLDSLTEVLKQFDQVFISINDTRPRPASKLDYSPDVKAFIARIAEHKNTVISVFANAYAIANLPGIEKCGSLLLGYQLSNELQQSAFKVITGQIKPKGKLPVTINNNFITGSGLNL
jgi:beta-glucosidase-like glycosyl hydrolase